MSKNQCDGCCRGLPVDEHGIHRGKSRYDLQCCTKSQYESPEKSGQIVDNAVTWGKTLPDELVSNWSILDLVTQYLSNCSQNAIDPLTMKKIDIEPDPDDLVEHEERWDGLS